MKRVLMIYDDHFDGSNKHDKSLLKSAISGRHYCISLALITHDLTLVDRVSRDQATHLILTSQLNEKVLRDVTEKYLLAACVSDEDIMHLISLHHYKNKPNPFMGTRTPNVVVKDTLMRTIMHHTKDDRVVVILPKEYLRKKNHEFLDLIKYYKAP